jgi:hypothetical protein
MIHLHYSHTIIVVLSRVCGGVLPQGQGRPQKPMTVAKMHVTAKDLALDQSYVGGK